MSNDKHILLTLDDGETYHLFEQMDNESSGVDLVHIASWDNEFMQKLKTHPKIIKLAEDDDNFKSLTESST